MIEIEINTAIAGRARGDERLTAAELAELDTVDVLSLGMLADLSQSFILPQISARLLPYMAGLADFQPKLTPLIL